MSILCNGGTVSRVNDHCHFVYTEAVLYELTGTAYNDALRHFGSNQREHVIHYRVTVYFTCLNILIAYVDISVYTIYVGGYHVTELTVDKYRKRVAQCNQVGGVYTHNILTDHTENGAVVNHYLRSCANRQKRTDRGRGDTCLCITKGKAFSANLCAGGSNTGYKTAYNIENLMNNQFFGLGIEVVQYEITVLCTGFVAQTAGQGIRFQIACQIDFTIARNSKLSHLEIAQNRHSCGLRCTVEYQIDAVQAETLVQCIQRGKLSQRFVILVCKHHQFVAVGGKRIGMLLYNLIVGASDGNNTGGSVNRCTLVRLNLTDLNSAEHVDHLIRRVYGVDHLEGLTDMIVRTAGQIQLTKVHGHHLVVTVFILVSQSHKVILDHGVAVQCVIIGSNQSCLIHLVPKYVLNNGGRLKNSQAIGESLGNQILGGQRIVQKYSCLAASQCLRIRQILQSAIKPQLDGCINVGPGIALIHRIAGLSKGTDQHSHCILQSDPCRGFKRGRRSTKYVPGCICPRNCTVIGSIIQILKRRRIYATAICLVQHQTEQKQCHLLTGYIRLRREFVFRRTDDNANVGKNIDFILCRIGLRYILILSCEHGRNAGNEQSGRKDTGKKSFETSVFHLSFSS